MFIQTDFIIDAVLRQGIQEIRDSLGTTNDKIEDIFSQFKSNYLSTYYGAKEINEIKKAIRGSINVTHAFPLENKNEHPLIVIQLLGERESENLSAFEDFHGNIDTVKSQAVLVSSFDVDSYNSAIGLIDCTSSNPDLSNISTNSIFVDGDGNSFAILGGITNISGDKHFIIESGHTVNLTGCTIVDAQSFTRKETSSVRMNQNIVLSICTNNANLTKYLYTIVLYILLSHKLEFINQGIDLASFEGSDFTRKSQNLPENMFVRSLTISSRMVEHTWSARDALILGDTEMAIRVLRDKYPRQDEDDYTIQTIDPDDLLD